MSTLEERILWILAKRNWTQRELARRAGLSGGAIGVLMTRLRREPGKTIDTATAVGIAKAARVSLAWLTSGIGEPEAPESGPVYRVLRDLDGWGQAREGALALLPPGFDPRFVDEAGDYVVPDRPLSPYLVAKLAELLALTASKPGA